MASSLGIRDLKDLAIPSGWDAGVLKTMEMEDGTTYEQVVDRLVGAVAGFNAMLGGHPWLPTLFSPTTRREVRYRHAAGQNWGRHSEYALPDQQRAQITGHMLPRKEFDSGLGWTWKYLSRAILEDIDADITVFLEEALDLFEREALTRFFKYEEETAAADGFGSSGVGPPFADGGNGTLSFTPPPYGGQTFASTHTHFLRYASGSLASELEAMADHLWEHGHLPPWDLMIPLADVATYTGLPNFTPRPAEGIRYGLTQDVALIEEPYIGVYSTNYGAFRVWPSARIPTNYAGAYKPYGVNDPRNPMRWWYNERFGQGIVSVAADKVGFPVQSILGYAEFGFGVGPDRTNGVCMYIAASGSYSTPTIS